MNFLSRINAVLHGKKPDKVPFAPYDNLVPRGELERELRNMGMGFCLRRSTIHSQIEGISIETKNEADSILNIYHTPLGSVQTRSIFTTNRLSDTGLIEVEGLIKSREDYDAVIYMLENTSFRSNMQVYHDTLREIGSDGIFRDSGLDHDGSPYAATRRYFGYEQGLESWIGAQREDPDHFAELVSAQRRRDERRLELVMQSPAEFIGFGWLEGIWSPRQFRTHELEFYQQCVGRLQSQGKICALHIDVTRGQKAYRETIAEIGAKVIEAFTPAPVGELNLQEARQAWGDDAVIWINYPETIFWSGRQAAYEYTKQLLHDDPCNRSMVISFTETGLWGADNDQTWEVFKDGTLAIMDAINDHGMF